MEINKETEELLNKLRKEDDYWSEKKHDYPFPDYYSLNREDLHLLLSYIEQLEKENKELKDIADEPIQIPNFLFDMSQELKIDELEKEIKNLKNQVNTINNNNEELKRRLKRVQQKRDTHKAVRYKLENNRDKVIRTLETLKGSARWERHLYEVDYIIDILKGGSE